MTPLNLLLPFSPSPSPTLGTKPTIFDVVLHRNDLGENFGES